MKWVIIIIAVVAALIVIIYIIGALMPVKHTARRTVQLNASPAQVWRTLTDIRGYSAWRRGIKSIEVHDDRRWTEVSGDGTVSYEADWVQPNEHLVSRIVSKDLPFGGSWSYHLAPEGNGTLLTITENGEVYNPFFRFMSKYVFGHEATMKAYAEDLEKHLNK